MLRTSVLSILARDYHFSTCSTTSSKLSTFQVRDSARTNQLYDMSQSVTR